MKWNVAIVAVVASSLAATLCGGGIIGDRGIGTSPGGRTGSRIIGDRGLGSSPGVRMATGIIGQAR